MIKQIFFNPFRKIAGTKALLLGFLIIATTAAIAYFSHCHFDGIIDAHVGAHGPVTLYFLEAIINWAITAGIFFLTAKILSKSKIRFIDIGGTTALARYPYFFVALIAFAVPELNPESLADFQNINPEELVGLVLTGILMLLFSIWFIALLYRAFSVSANLKGSRSIWGFIGALIIAEILSMIAFHYLYLNF